jgi:hypothetical protein
MWHGEKEDEYRVLVGRPEGNRPLRRPGCRSEDIKLDITEIGKGCMECIILDWDRNKWRAFVITMMNLWFPLSMKRRHKP